jgi:putative tryptophan/tyrosine transport system substrate-binding protein
MRRREFITLVGGAAVGWPLTTHAQQQLPVIGYLGSSTPSIDRPRAAAFVKRLNELGWVNDRNVRIELRWAEASAERAREVAAEFVRLKVDVIMTYGSVNVLAAKQATATIPIVFVAGDPLGTGLVESLARPGGNATGLSLEVTGTASKRLALLREIVPSLRQLAIVGNVVANNSAKTEMNEVQTAARTFGLEVIVSDLHRPEDIDPAIEALKGRADALYICADPFVTTNETHINSSALSARLPTMHGLPENAAAGGLLAYGVDFSDLCRRAAEIVDKILRGAKPANIPVEQPTTFKFVINLKTAKALGLAVPYSTQLLADEVIE